MSLRRTRETPRGRGDNIGHSDVTSEHFVRSNDVSKKYLVHELQLFEALLFVHVMRHETLPRVLGRSPIL